MELHEPKKGCGGEIFHWKTLNFWQWPCIWPLQNIPKEQNSTMNVGQVGPPTFGSPQYGGGEVECRPIDTVSDISLIAAILLVSLVEFMYRNLWILGTNGDCRYRHVLPWLL